MKINLYRNQLVELIRTNIIYYFDKTRKYIKSNKKLLDYINKSIDLYCNYYYSLIDEGFFENSDSYLSDIIDNDIVNNTEVIDPDHEDYEEIEKIYFDWEGATHIDISEIELKSSNKYSFIEYQYNNYFLVRY